MTVAAPAPRAVIDVGGLPGAVEDHRSPIWWGNLWLLVIESTVFALLLASYFYLWDNYEQWPPPRVDRGPVVYDTDPWLVSSTIMTALMLLSVAPMLYTDRACLRMDERGARQGLIATAGFGVVTNAVAFWNFGSLWFKWNDNAYASVTWTLLGTHLAHDIVATCEMLLMLAWIVRKGLDVKHARDVRVTAVYWYWVVGVWTLLYAVIYWVPRAV